MGGERIWSLAYADDLVIMAKSEEEIKEMLKRMEKYLKRKKLYVNIKKSKMICFRSEGGRKRTEWKWEGQNIEEVKEFKYLGYVVKENGGQEGQIKESKKKGNIVLKQVWGLGEQRFRDDFKRRIKLFRYLVLGVIMYGAEVWGWKEREELERIQKRYIKCTLNFDSCTPDYVVYKETNVEKIGTIAGCRAVKFEEKAIKEGYRKLVVECVKEKEREGNDKTLVGAIGRGFIERTVTAQRELSY